MSETAPTDRTLARYGQYLESLSRARLAALGDFVAPDVHFKDPFNDCHGIGAMRHVLEHMYDTLDDVRFIVSCEAMGQQDGFLAWRYECLWRNRPIAFDGVSHVTFADDGLVARHVDHWDAAGGFYETLPLIGRPLAFLRRRIAAV